MSANNEPPTEQRSDHPVRDVLLIVSVLLAALQVIPMYVPSKGMILIAVTGAALLCAVSLFLLRHNQRFSATWRRRILQITAGLIVGGVVSYHISSLQSEVNRYQDMEAAKAGQSVLSTYLDAVVQEHSSQWNGEFEKRYARPTLYLLSGSGIESKPSDVQKVILRWRAGSDGISQAFLGMTYLTGEPPPEPKIDMSRAALDFMSYVLRPMADSDLLNKRTKDPQPGIPNDDVPQRVLVLGDPAAGKSSMLERLDLIQARRARGSSSEGIPVLIRLKGMAAPTKEPLITKIRERLGAAFDLVLKERSVVLLIDALDEAEDPAKAAASIGELVDDPVFQRGVDRIVVTGRLLNYSNDVHPTPFALRHKLFHTTILFGLDQTAIEKQILGSHFTIEQKGKIMQKLSAPGTRSAWLQFLRMPMNFDLISEIMGELDNQDIAQGQTEIIRRFIDRRFAQKGMNAADAEDAKRLLQKIALALVDDGVTRRSRDFSAEDALPKELRGRDVSADNLKAMEERLIQIESTGLIRKGKLGQYRFFHLNLQDYFTAMAMTDLTKVDPSQVVWRQIILFIAGKQDGGSVEDLLQRAMATQPTPYLEELTNQVRSVRVNIGSQTPDI